jgi:hypothetical protein
MKFGIRLEGTLLRSADSTFDFAKGKRWRLSPTWFDLLTADG